LGGGLFTEGCLAEVQPLHHLVDDAMAVRANGQTITGDGGLNLAGGAISNAGDRWTVAEILGSLYANSSIHLSAKTFGHLIAMRQFQPRVFTLDVEFPRLGVRAGARPLGAFCRALIATCHVLTKIGQHGAYSFKRRPHVRPYQNAKHSTHQYGIFKRISGAVGR
jgi:hypothetical protein